MKLEGRKETSEVVVSFVQCGELKKYEGFFTSAVSYNLLENGFRYLDKFYIIIVK